MSMDGRGGGVTSTDTDGRYEIKDLPGGRYSISATKSGYITSQYGQRRPGEPGTPVEIADGFPASRDKWKPGSRYVRTLRPDTQGRYSIKSLPPGEDYLVIAWGASGAKVSRSPVGARML